MGRRSPLWRDYSSSFLLVAAPHSQQNGRQGRSKIFSPSILLVAAPPPPPPASRKEGEGDILSWGILSPFCWLKLGTESRNMGGKFLLRRFPPFLINVLFWAAMCSTHKLERNCRRKLKTPVRQGAPVHHVAVFQAFSCSPFLL